MDPEEGQAQQSLEQELKFDPAKPSLFIVMGPQGVGKTSVARAVRGVIDEVTGAEPLESNAIVIRSDVVRKNMFGPNPQYTAESSAQVYRRMLELAKKAMLQKHKSVILDATYSDPRRRVEVEEVARQELGVEPLTILVGADRETVKTRLAKRAQGSDASDATDIALYDRDTKKIADNPPTGKVIQIDNTDLGGMQNPAGIRNDEPLREKLRQSLGLPIKSY